MKAQTTKVMGLILIFSLIVIGSVSAVKPIEPEAAATAKPIDPNIPTITVNWTFTGMPGTDAKVINVGSLTHLKLDFTIPRGLQGLQGIQGIQGLQGIPGVCTGGCPTANWKFGFTDVR